MISSGEQVGQSCRPLYMIFGPCLAVDDALHAQAKPSRLPKLVTNKLISSRLNCSLCSSLMASSYGRSLGYCRSLEPSAVAHRFRS